MPIPVFWHHPTEKMRNESKDNIFIEKRTSGKLCSFFAHPFSIIPRSPSDPFTAPTSIMSPPTESGCFYHSRISQHWKLRFILLILLVLFGPPPPIPIPCSPMNRYSLRKPSQLVVIAFKSPHLIFSFGVIHHKR